MSGSSKVGGGTSTLGVATGGISLGCNGGKLVGRRMLGCTLGGDATGGSGEVVGVVGRVAGCVVVCGFDGAGTSILAGLRRLGIRGVVIVTGFGIGGGIVGTCSAVSKISAKVSSA